MRKGSICVTAPEQPKAVLSELIVAAGKCDCELVVPDPEDITFLEAEKFASKVDYGGYTVPLAFLGRHAAGNAAMAVELALALCRKGFDIPDEAILDGLAAVKNRSSIRVISQRPLVILDACRTPQQASALLRVLNMAKVRHMSAIIGLAEEEGAEAFFSALETGLTPEEQKKDKSTMPGMSDNPFDKVYLVTPTGGDDALTERLTEKAKFHFDAELCATLAEAVELAHANTRRGLLVCGSEAAALEAAFDFMEQAFAESQEMVVFVTELTVNPASHQFLTENGCERYFQYNKDLLLDHRKAALQQELAAEQRRHGGV